MTKKHLILYILILAVFLSAFPFQAAASSADGETTVLSGDGWHIVVTITEIATRATQQKTASKEFKYIKDSDGTVLWTITLTGTFTYTGTSSSCTNAAYSVTSYSSSWYEVSGSASKSGNTASCTVTMGRKFLGITVEKPNFTLTLTCDKNGNLS